MGQFSFKAEFEKIKVIDSYPELKEMIFSLEKNNFLITTDDIKIIQKNEHWDRKIGSRVLNILFGISYTQRLNFNKTICSVALRNILYYIVNNPRYNFDREELLQLNRDDLPNSIRKIFVGEEKYRQLNFIELVISFVAPLYYEYRDTGRLSFYPEFNDWDLLVGIMKEVTITEHDWVRFDKSENRSSYKYLDTGCPLLNSHNRISFLNYFLYQDTDRGRIQSKIPLSLSKALGGDRVNLLHLTVLSDLFSLAYTKVIPNLPEEMALYSFTLDANEASKYYSISPKVKSISDIFWLNEDASDLIIQRRSDIYGKTFTSFIFNIPNYLKREKSPLFSQIISSYESINIDKLYNLIEPDYRQNIQLLKDNLIFDFNPILIRNFRNTIFFINYIRDNGYDINSAIPSVIKFLFQNRSVSTSSSGRVKVSKVKSPGNEINRGIPKILHSIQNVESCNDDVCRYCGK